MSQEPIGFIQDGEEAGSIQEKLNKSILESNNYRKHKDGTEAGFSHNVEKIKYDDVDVEGVPTPRNVKEAIEQINLATKNSIPSKTSELTNDAEFITPETLPKYPIEDGISWDGTLHTIDMVASKQYTLNVANGTTSLMFGFENCTDQVKDVIIRINNSLNSAVIHTIVFNGDWKFSIGDPITGLAPNTNFELIVRNISLTQVKGSTDVES